MNFSIMPSKENSFKEELVDSLRKQLSEIELLQAMYPNPGDIVLPEKNLSQMSNFIECDSELYIPESLDFVINLHVNDLKLELFINLPISYPTDEPDILVRCNKLNRQQETDLNTGLSEFIKFNHVGEVCLYTAITWLQDNIEIFTVKQDIGKEILSSEENLVTGEKFTRLWIYSHHIYNKKKREEIQKSAKTLNLTGFCLAGKPGVICVEGNESSCSEWWRGIKSMCWKKIVIRKTETFETIDELNKRRFKNFEELHFSGSANSKHANMSEFSKYMTDHGFGQIFSDFFGLCNE